MDMELDTQTPLYAALTVLGNKRNAARIDYEAALVNDNALAAVDAWRRRQFAEQEIVVLAKGCERRGRSR
jgi:hypothetical protein